MAYPVRIAAIDVRALEVPLLHPFAIATARMIATRSVEVKVTVSSMDGTLANGLGEGAALPPVTSEDLPDVLVSIRRAAAALVGRHVDVLSEAFARDLDALFPDAPVARSAVEVALLDASARILGLTLRAWLGGERGRATRALTTDITLPIAAPDDMAFRARTWSERGFGIFKVKVGLNLDQDIKSLVAVKDAVPGARFRIDANAGFSSGDAVRMARALEEREFEIECYEQPCAADDLDAMARVTEAVDPPVIADESVKTLSDLHRVIAHRAADGVNLKIVKSGGLLAARTLGEEARRRGMPVMVGGMVETRLGMTAGAHLAATLGGVAFVDLDTAWLLAEDPYEGGYRAKGPMYDLGDEPGLGVRPIR